MSITLHDIADRVGGTLHGDASKTVNGLAPISEAGPLDISFVSDHKHQAQIADSQAGCLLLTDAMAESCTSDHIVVKDAYLAYALVSYLFRPASPKASIHSSAVIGEHCHIGECVTLGAHVVIGDHVTLEQGVTVAAGSYVGNHSHLSEDVYLYPNVTCYHGVRIGRDTIVHSGSIIGGDGFGYAKSDQGWQKIYQLGGVVIGDRVEVGANCTIDRGSMGDTIIGSDVKLDNMVHIAHNVNVGDHTIMAGCSGIAGSTTVGKHCQIAGQSGLLGHITVCDNVTVLGRSFISKSIDKPGVYSSAFPAEPVKQWRKNVVRFMQLDKLARRINENTHK